MAIVTLSGMVPPVATSLLTPELQKALKANGIPTALKVIVFACDPVSATLEARFDPSECVVINAKTPAEITKICRQERLVAVVAAAEEATAVLRQLSAAGVTVGLVAYEGSEAPSQAAILRTQGAMDVMRGVTDEDIAVVRRALEYRALLILELAHRCESRRLVNRELELLGQPPESMSDDLSVFQPPPLPVGPLSVYNLDQASEAFETAYIDRVQQLCSSAREAAQYLGVSSATLSRRQRKEAGDGA